MKYVNKITILSLVFLLGISILLVRCTSERQFRVLSFFFDGVPDSSKVIGKSSDSAKVVLSKNNEPTIYFHPPYFEKKCKSCHQGGFSNALIVPMPDLCYTCHDDFNTNYQTLHGPVASGNCTACHNQHEAKFKKLLLREGRQICLFCHELKDVSRNKIHATIENKNCTECHDPHGGENRGILNQGICYNCHEKFDSKYNFLHGPVASVNCTGCHGSHSSGSAKLLLREAQELCLFCHNSEDVFKNDAHKKSQKKNCTVCHNPHGGGDRFILTSAIRPFTVNPSAKKAIESKADSVPKTIPETKEGIDSTATKLASPSDSGTQKTTKEIPVTDSIPKTIPETKEIKDSTTTKLASPSDSGTQKTTKEKMSGSEVLPNQAIDPIKNDSILINSLPPVDRKVSPEKTDTINLYWTAPKK